MGILTLREGGLLTQIYHPITKFKLMCAGFPLVTF